MNIFKIKNTQVRLILMILIMVVLFIIPTLIVSAETKDGFVPLEPIPGVTDSNDPVEYFNSLYRLGIIIAGFLAVIMIVAGGFKYMTTEAVSGKGEAKEIITSALAGLFLILLSVILLQIINPDILKFNLFKKTATLEYLNLKNIG